MEHIRRQPRLIGMMHRRVVLLVAGISVLLFSAACGQAGGGPGLGPGGRGSGSYANTDVVVRVEYTGGFLPPSSLATRLPLVSIYGDGRVITEGPVIAIYPAPALPNVQVQQISADDVRKLADRALAGGVGSELDLGQPPIADAPSTRFTVLTDAGPKVTEVYALGEAGGDQSGLTDAQRAARGKLRDLLAALTDLPKTLGAGAVGESRPYVPTELAGIASPWTGDGEGLPAPPEVAWPGPQLPGEPFASGLDLGCVTVTGEQATRVLSLAESANVNTPWVSGGKRWRVGLRPLLPDETGCEDLR